MIAFCCDWCGTAAPGKFVPAEEEQSDDDDVDVDIEINAEVSAEIDAIASSVQYGTPSGWLARWDGVREWHSCSKFCAHNLQQCLDATTQSVN